MKWKPDNNSDLVPKVEVFMDKYAMRLDFGQAAANGKIPARIYLCVPDQHKSYVAGNFEVAFEDAGAAARLPANAEGLLMKNGIIAT